MKLEIVTPSKKVFEGDVVAENVPGSQGAFEILNNHAPIISSLDKGTTTLRMKDGKTQSFSMDTGVIEVLNNHIVILSESVLPTK